MPLGSYRDEVNALLKSSEAAAPSEATSRRRGDCVAPEKCSLICCSKQCQRLPRDVQGCCFARLHDAAPAFLGICMAPALKMDIGTFVSEAEQSL